MFYVYVLENELKDTYTGYSRNLRERLAKHNQGINFSTKNHAWRCIYYEACLDEDDARRRERYLKTTAGRRTLKLRLKEYFYKRRKPKFH
jgi:putative endonuclease